MYGRKFANYDLDIKYWPLIPIKTRSRNKLRTKIDNCRNIETWIIDIFVVYKKGGFSMDIFLFKTDNWG